MFENQVPANVKRKSQSATNVCPNTGFYIDIVTNHEGPPTCRPKQSTTSLKISDQKPSHRAEHEQKPVYTSVKYQKPSENFVSNKTPNTMDRSCTCCVRVNKADAATQYDLSVETFASKLYDVPWEVCVKTTQLQLLNFSLYNCCC